MSFFANSPENHSLSEDNVLDEKDFIYRGKEKEPIPFWMFFAIVAAIFSFLWIGGNWIFKERQTKIENNPFLQVTNREMSLFLWENPELMRQSARNKTAYLPGFHSVGRNANPKLETVEKYVTAPPQVLFKYHTWDRLLGDKVFARPITRDEFSAFLKASPEWLPEHWPKAPEEYKQLIKEFGIINRSKLQTLPKAVLPKDVRKAFVGWKNYYREGDAINRLSPTLTELRQFLIKHPNYCRHHWQNIYPNYLKSLADPSLGAQETIPNEEMPPFLRAAFYNAQRANSSAQAIIK